MSAPLENYRKWACIWMICRVVVKSVFVNNGASDEYSSCTTDGRLDWA